jgi:hypothetical protein
MGRQHFDELARALARGRLPRRGALRVLGSSALASFGVAALVDARGQAQGDGHARSQADRNRRTRQFQCRPSGIKCKLKKASSPRGLCKNCCETFQKRSKTTGRCCTPNGRPCSSAAECCLGVCSVGLCQNTVVTLPCVAFGGVCAQSGECCDGVPCTGSRCQPCVPRGQACTATNDCCLTLGDAVLCSDGICT